MKNHPTSRRQLLRLLGGAPLLPLSSSVLTAGMLSACGGGNGDAAPAAPARFESVSFSGMGAPDLSRPAAMATPWTEAVLTAHYDNGTRRDFKLAYEPFFVTGDRVADGSGGDILAGGYYDIRNRPILDITMPGRERQFFSDCPDGMSLLAVPDARVGGVQGKPVFAVVQFEYTTLAQDGSSSMYGRLPSPIAVLTLDQDQATGRLSLVKYHNVDTSPVHGLWITCGASLSPWGTHLSSEEYEPDAFTIDRNDAFKAYSKNLYGDEAAANPYHYGHMPEVTVHPDGTASIKKHFCLGRISHELVQVMPDRRTALMGDDATNGAYFVFVADRENDLSSGTLYAAKVGAGFSIDPDGTAAPLTWIELGSATSAEIEALANTLKPTDIMAVADADPQDPGFTRIAIGGRAEWIRIHPGMEKAAAFLETHRYAAFVGASAGFTKMEGTTVNAADKIAYSALSYVQKSMVAGDAANVPGAGVSVPKALQAGAVMALNLRGDQRDTAGRAIRSNWMPVDIKALLVGEDIAADALGNTAHPDKIANPDNLKFSEKMRTLFIGEDSGMHVNNALWAYQVDRRELTRILSVPAGAEATGLHAVDEINGWTYITCNFQHAGEWEKIHAAVRDTLDPLIDARYHGKFGAAVGYLTSTLHSVQL